FVTETIPAESKKVETLQSQEKIGVYMKEWYSQIEKWVSDLKQLPFLIPGYTLFFFPMRHFYKINCKIT
ncbi:hypothetical protein, partial [Bacillus cereus]